MRKPFSDIVLVIAIGRGPTEFNPAREGPSTCNRDLSIILPIV
jgi:hypothetical protein